MQHGVSAQQARNPRIANDWCYPRVDEGGWKAVDICEVQIFDERRGRPTSRVTHLRGRPTVCASLTWPRPLRLRPHNHTSAMVTQGLPLSGPVKWSRDGAHLALLVFEGASGWTDELVVIDPDGSNLTRLTHGVGFGGATHGHRAETRSRSAATLAACRN